MFEQSMSVFILIPIIRNTTILQHENKEYWLSMKPNHLEHPTGKAKGKRILVKPLFENTMVKWKEHRLWSQRPAF